jgi:hypothetical protein
VVSDFWYHALWSAKHLRQGELWWAKEARMLFMVIERFEGNDMLPVYRRVRDEGRGLPEGLKYLSSWIEPNFARCFQLQ